MGRGSVFSGKLLHSSHWMVYDLAEYIGPGKVGA